MKNIILTNKKPIISLYSKVIFDVFDKNKKQTLHQEFFGESVTANLLCMMYAGFNGNAADADWSFTAPYTNNRQARSLNDTLIALANGANFPNFIDSKTSEYLQGIIFGIGTQALSPSLPQLNTEIVHGVGAGQLSYFQNTSPLGITISGNDTILQIQRVGVNNSGNTISISEVGIYCTSFPAYQTNRANIFMLYYDIVAPAVDVLNSQTVSCTIEFRTTT